MGYGFITPSCPYTPVKVYCHMCGPTQEDCIRCPYYLASCPPE